VLVARARRRARQRGERRTGSAPDGRPTDPPSPDERRRRRLLPRAHRRGDLRSGNRIDFDAVGAELGVSRLPVREALVILERDGLVSTVPHRGTFVEPFDAESITDDVSNVSKGVRCCVTRRS
jgi:DNA-binding GntR family transcriptional regulator